MKSFQVPCGAGDRFQDAYPTFICALLFDAGCAAGYFSREKVCNQIVDIAV